MTEQSVLVLFSGGQDSTTCLAWALERFERVETVGFDYRQRNRIDLAALTEISDVANFTAIRPLTQVSSL
jgi:7-cyano-7-deazaguanine synthase